MRRSVWKKKTKQNKTKTKTKIAFYANSLSKSFHHPCRSLFYGRDHLRSNMGITSGPGSFAVQFGDHLRSGIICGPGIICGAVQLVKMFDCKLEIRASQSLEDIFINFFLASENNVVTGESCFWRHIFLIF